MAKVIVLTGQKFARWTVLDFSHQVGKMLYWKCRCDCGVERAVFGADLKRGMSKSCGCLMRELLAKRQTTHARSGEPIYQSWQSMKERCYNQKGESYHLYGGRGIVVCQRWLDSAANFIADMQPTWKPGLSLDRKDTNGNYEKDNCRWATPVEQGRNRRNNRYINTPDGPMPITAAAEKFGVSSRTIHSRIRYGWPEQDLLLPIYETPARKIG